MGEKWLLWRGMKTLRTRVYKSAIILKKKKKEEKKGKHHIAASLLRAILPQICDLDYNIRNISITKMKSGSRIRLEWQFMTDIYSLRRSWPQGVDEAGNTSLLARPQAMGLSFFLSFFLSCFLCARYIKWCLHGLLIWLWNIKLENY